MDEIEDAALGAIDKALVEFVSKTMDGVDAAVGFFEAQLPDYIYQLLLWYLVVGFIEFAIGLVGLFAIGWFVIKKQSPWVLKNLDESDGLSALTFVLTALVISPFCELMNLQWLQILLAPKVWLVEYVRALI